MKSFFISDILDLKNNNIEKEVSKDATSTDENSGTLSTKRTYAAQANFWKNVSIKVEIDPISQKPYATVSVIAPSSISLNVVHKKLKDKIRTRKTCPLKGKISTSMNTLDFRMDLIDNSMTKEEFEEAVYSLKTHKEPDERIRKRTLLSDLAGNSPATDTNSSNNFNKLKYAAQVKFWETVSIDVRTNEDSNLPYAIVSIIPPNSTSIKDVCKKMSDKIQTRNDSVLKNKVSIEMVNSSQFCIALIDNSMTQEEFESAVNSLKKHQFATKITSRNSFAFNLQTSEAEPSKRNASTENTTTAIVKMKRRKIGLEELPIANMDSEETNAKQNEPETFEAQDKIDTQPTTILKNRPFGLEDWRRVSISVNVDANTNRLYAVVTINPPDFFMLKRLCERMKKKIRDRKNSPLKDKISIHFPNHEEAFPNQGNFYFLIELKDNSITPQEFEIAVDHLLFNGNNKIRMGNLYQSIVRNEQTPEEITGGPELSVPSDEVIEEQELKLTPRDQKTSPDDTNMDEYENLLNFSFFNQRTPSETRDSDSLFDDTNDYHFGPF